MKQSMTKNLEISYTLSYSSRDEDTRDTVKDITFNFDNPSPDELVDNINTRLLAIKMPIEVAIKG